MQNILLHSLQNLFQSILNLQNFDKLFEKTKKKNSSLQQTFTCQTKTFGLNPVLIILVYIYIKKILPVSDKAAHVCVYCLTHNKISRNLTPSPPRLHKLKLLQSCFLRIIFRNLTTSYSFKFELINHLNLSCLKVSIAMDCSCNFISQNSQN